MRLPAWLPVVLFLFAFPALAQREVSGSVEIQLALQRLLNTGSVMMIAAHPDDENTALLATLARGRALRTAYLSVTRGEGGQNLIGPEQGALLGLIRTQELLAARRIDGAEQYFTRAIDFGFSKRADESLEKWGRERTLADIVWNIRSFRPDVVILRFSGTPRDGHGQHQASAILGREAFTAAADPKRFPEQLQYVTPWQARRLMWNTFSFTSEQERESATTPGRVEIDTGEYSPLLGYSYAEIAGMSRSMHRSQAMGSPERKGSQKQYLVTVAGEPAHSDLADGVDTTWRRLAGGDAVATQLQAALDAFRPDHPELVLPYLAKARPLIAAMKDPIAARKLVELDETMARAAGVWADATADGWMVTPGETMAVAAETLVRAAVPVELRGVALAGLCEASSTAARRLPANVAYRDTRPCAVPAVQPYTQPYWLRRPPVGESYTVIDPELIGLADTAPIATAVFHLVIAGQGIQITRPVRYRWVDRSRGERTRPVVVAPPVALRFPERSLVFPDSQPRRVEVEVHSNSAAAPSALKIDAPAGWNATPREQALTPPAAGQQAMAEFSLTPDGTRQGTLTASAGGVSSGMTVIDYPHIPPQVLFPPAEARLVHADIRTLAHRIGYVMGSGDEVPEALRQIGCEVTLLTPDLLATGDLARFDAIVTGVRAFAVRADLRANQPRLLAYMSNGGTLVVQYNTLDGHPLDRIGPYPIEISHARVSVEEAPVRFTDPASPLLNSPNRITAADFEGWIQERGLYFASSWDPRYKTLFESNDPGEPPQPGGTLYAKVGKGAYVFTAYSWFRELPAGVPGAYRIFANLLSAARTLP